MKTVDKSFIKLIELSDEYAIKMRNSKTATEHRVYGEFVERIDKIIREVK